MPRLGVNIDHVATVRNARYKGGGDDVAAPGTEPDPVFAAHEAVLAGADIITVHLREDRRHIHDRDLDLLTRLSPSGGGVRLNLEMAATDEMLDLARRLAKRPYARGPHMATLVPEGRTEVTTEGGLDVAGQLQRLKTFAAALTDAGIVPSAFIDADPAQVQAAAAAGFAICEVHTGPYAAAFTAAGGEMLNVELAAHLARVAEAGRHIRAARMRFNAGHALNYHNVGPIAALPGIAELHIGHAIISRAVFVGLHKAVAEMKHAIAAAASTHEPRP
jgi:pyridoxine 5-phosphate synthase